MRMCVALCALLTLASPPQAGAEELAPQGDPLATSRPRASITDVERQRLLAHLEMTAGWLRDEVSGLSRPQLDFRRGPGTWTIMGVLDHLVVVGQIYWDDLRRALQTPATAPGSSGSDSDILWYGIDRTHRETALTSENPRQQVRDLRAALDRYRAHHDRLVDYVRRTKDDLRRHRVERQGCDAYQWALLISTHDQRHILQIREIKSHAKYPKR